jgi:hypothetical protein
MSTWRGDEPGDAFCTKVITLPPPAGAKLILLLPVIPMAVQTTLIEVPALKISLLPGISY